MADPNSIEQDKNDYGIGWDYEDSGNGQYHIYVVVGHFDGQVETITLDLPQTPENDADVQAIVDALRRISARAHTE